LARRIWEPACGPGAIVRILREAGHIVTATDLVDYGCPDSRGGVDFLKVESAPDDVECIVTNPPYRIANEFAAKALELVPRVILLLRLNFLEALSRTDILDDGRLAWVYPFIRRLPHMHRDSWDRPKTGSAMALAWFRWDRNHRGPPRKLSGSDSRNAKCAKNRSLGGRMPFSVAIGADNVLTALSRIMRRKPFTRED